MNIRVATFNVENLFARYRFREGFDPADGSGFGINNLAFNLYDDGAKSITGKAIREVGADVICLQEVENLLAQQLPPTLPAMRALGVRPLAAFLRGEMGKAEAIERAKTETRQYAKRQGTWLRGNMITWKLVKLK